MLRSVVDIDAEDADEDNSFAAATVSKQTYSHDGGVWFLNTSMYHSSVWLEHQVSHSIAWLERKVSLCMAETPGCMVLYRVLPSCAQQ